MKMNRFVTLLIAAFFICTEAHAGNLVETSLGRFSFTLSGVTFAIMLPKSAHVRNSHNEIKFDLTKGQRLQRNLIFAAAPLQPVVGNRRRVVLANVGVFEYAIEDDTGGGSGGPIAELTGRMQFGSHVLTVKCTDQGEFSREADWCLTYLNGLEIIK